MTAARPPAGHQRPDHATLRLFVGFGLDAALREVIAARCAALREALPSARWVPAPNLHLTLCFLGATPVTAVPALDAALRPVFAGTPCSRLVLTGGGSFPPGRAARVAWVAVGAEGPPAAALDLGRLAAAVSAAVAAAPRAAIPAGGRRVDRGFTPHVTLARPQPPWNRQASEVFGRAWDDVAGADLGCAVTAGLLLASELGGGPPRYRVVSSYRLLEPTREASSP